MSNEATIVLLLVVGHFLVGYLTVRVRHALSFSMPRWWWGRPNKPSQRRMLILGTLCGWLTFAMALFIMMVTSPLLIIFIVGLIMWRLLGFIIELFGQVMESIGLITIDPDAFEGAHPGH